MANTLFASIPNLSVMLGNYLQQTTSADDIFRCIFFLDTLRVNIDNFNWGPIISKVGNQNAFFTWSYFGKYFDLRLPNGSILARR